MAMSVYGWGTSKISAWKEMEAWRSRRAAFTANDLNAFDTFNSIFQQATTAKIDGMAQLAGEAALNRIQLAAKAKFDQVANTADAELDKLKVDKTA
jgi:hypothetical protein